MSVPGSPVGDSSFVLNQMRRGGAAVAEYVTQRSPLVSQNLSGTPEFSDSEFELTLHWHGRHGSLQIVNNKQ